MLTAYASSEGRLQPIDDPGDAALRRAVWINLAQPTEEEVARVRQATGLSVPSEPDISEIESSSRLARRDGALYLSLPLVSTVEPSPRGYAAGFVLSRDRLLTVRYAESLLFSRFVER